QQTGPLFDHGVDVKPVPRRSRGAAVTDRHVRVGERDVVDAVPFVADEPGLQVDLLHERVGDRTVGRTAVGGEVAADRVVDGEQRGPLRRDLEGVQVGLVAVAGTHYRDVAVGRVGDHYGRIAPAAVHERALPPGEDGATF